MKIKRMESLRQQRGFTLLELLAVMALVAILTGWGIGQWRRQQQVLRLEHTAQQLLAFLTRLQADANWRNRTALLWFRQGDPWCIGSGGSEQQCRPGNAWLFVPVHPDVALKDVTQKEMGFYGLRNNAQAGHITLGNGAGNVRVVLSAKGRLRLCSEGVAIGGITSC
ncbi:prepilin peptidase dependent protein A [Gibbsiella quercinecans]|uniref:N-terminal cleavage protein n=1 Tax=Gibbsiella quercinecans TaxID=929813 RepID=A0A250B3T0_9GAMM|nr:prepilin peptidase-dependent protein [Gibbsiella quercinecans]ATA20829.1 N-terminal cleavage protein [Gibbsiella quercinecans]RLM10457.1 prepilin-type N-terminal cleavage/methylation domain-containing protein [Gibbsiella quercinecans]TCT85879.1 prepilin peptidase dependent protein A [Gibbsiella quercinecans]